MDDAATLMDRMYRHQCHVYDLTRKYYLAGRDEAVARLRPEPGDTVLEIGCGTGRNLIKAARAYHEARFFGLDVSREMLGAAAASIARAGLSSRISITQADATAFDPVPLFGHAQFDRVMISYALSMIPPWRDALERALEVLAPGGSLHLVDFGPGAGLPGPFRTGLRRWLAAFDVTPRDGLGAALEALSAERGLTCKIETRFRGYAVLAVARPPSPRSGEGGP
jgi:S-adenosylmethionine-diacylgycerolhomoserine-N-methlytransferase